MRMVDFSLAAAEQLAQEGISAEVIDLRTIRPYDAETVLNSVKRTRRAVVVNEAPNIGGLGAELSATIAEECFSELVAPVARIGALDTPIPFSRELELEIMPNESHVLSAVRRLMKAG